MKTQTLFQLRELVLRLSSADHQEFPAAEVVGWQEQLPLLRQQTCRYLDFILGSLFHKATVRRQIRRVQTEATYLLNVLEVVPDLPDPTGTLKNELVVCLDAVMEYLFVNCRNLLDQDFLMPLLYLKREQSDLAGQTDLIRAWFTKHGVSKKLKDVVLVPLLGLVAAKKCSYLRLNYVKALQSSILLLEGGDRALTRLLMDCNFNTGGFMEYLQAEVRAELAEAFEVRAQFELLYDHQREFNSCPMRKQSGSFDPARRRNKEVMLEFINAEIRCLENKEHIRMSMANQLMLTNAVLPARNSCYRIQTTLSVDALAYLFRLLVEANIIEARVKTELLSFVAEIFHTPGMPAAGISAGSLGTKYKQVVQNTAIKVRTALKKMLRQVELDFP